jgi:adenosine kinase
VSGKEIGVAARMGAVVAAYAIEKYGTQEHHFSRIDFLDRYRQSFGPLEL